LSASFSPFADENLVGYQDLWQVIERLLALVQLVVPTTLAIGLVPDEPLAGKPLFLEYDQAGGITILIGDFWRLSPW
jgi:hypothetical protein